jgi:hypothetical protein
MDPVTMAYYAIVCAALAGVASAAGQRGRMVALGAVVGLAAAALLPLLRGAAGF